MKPHRRPTEKIILKMSDHPSAAAPIRLLLVDDDENVHPLIKYLLSKIPDKRFEVEWAATFQSGWEMIQFQKHDVYLVDYRLGVKNGLDLIRKAISSGIQAPIIILTGSDNPMVDLEATKIGVADFLIKDRLDSSILERSIRYAMQHSETLRDLQKSHERFRLLFERSRDAILISADNGQLIEVNSAACQLFGYAPEKLAQFKISDLLSSDLDNQSMQLGESSLGEVSFHLPDGERHFAEFSACHFGPNLNLCILRDISDRRKLEKEIQEISEKEQRRLGQDLHDGIG
ncbi:MAG: PAS domain S-box protein, partial [Verrucomicrobiota bacterium]|nr:PAS domain S-box protein [Verrucomicrobiota bacterium]